MNYSTTARRLGLLAAICAYSLTLSACKDGTAPLVPASIQVVAGAQQSAAAGAVLPVPPSVKVLAANGQPVRGVSVTFTPAAESGTIVGGSQITDAGGVAAVTSWTLGTKAGISTLNVTVQGVAPLAITATTTPGAATGFKVVTGDVQIGVAGAALATQPSVRVSDSFDNGVPGIPVVFAPSAGSVQNPQVQTDANGVASAGTWTLGTKSGVQSLSATATAASLTVPLVFSATAAPDVASNLAILTQPATTNASGQRLTVQPVVEFRDRFGNAAVLTGARTVTAAVAVGNGTLGGTTTITTQTGRVAFSDLTFTGTGPVQLRFTSSGFADALSDAFTLPVASLCTGTAITLNYALGQMSRSIANASDAPVCIDFSKTANAGQQYMLMFENLSPRGNNYSTGLFPGAPVDDGTFQIGLQASGATSGQLVQPAQRAITTAPPQAINGWQFEGGEPVYEIQPKSPSQPALIKRNGDWISANSEMAAPKTGDTLLVQLEGVPRLGVPTALRRAIIRYVDANIVIAEDLRFTTDPTFLRSNGARNSPIPDADLQQIATEYANYALVQENRLFSDRYNSAIETDPGRPIAVHTMMYSDNIWGYTYSSTNYFAFDYWVNSTDGHTKDLYQNSQREADDLFMHEIAHMRHWGMLERTLRTNVRGNQWLVEGFARFSERLPIAARLLGTQNFSRTSNVVLPYNMTYILNSDGRVHYFFDDVPTYLQTASNMFDGYGAAAFVFDYFADQVANKGGNWITALQELLVNAGVQSDVDAVVNRYLGIDFGTLFSRARVALYLDDIGTPGLPATTQYLQYQLRASRPPSTLSGADPRNLWTKITPGLLVSEARSIPIGTSFGYVIDGTAATADMHLVLNLDKVPNGIISLVRIK